MGTTKFCTHAKAALALTWPQIPCIQTFGNASQHTFYPCHKALVHELISLTGNHRQPWSEGTSNSKKARACNVCSQAGEGLFAGASHSHQQGGCTVHGKHAGEAGEMRQRILEQHQLSPAAALALHKLLLYRLHPCPAEQQTHMQHLSSCCRPLSG